MPEEPNIPVIVERIANLQGDVSDIKRDMATRSDQAHVDERIMNLTAALADERAQRVADVERERRDRITAIRDEQAARGAVAARLQTVEDRLEARKYNVMIALTLSGVGALFGLAGTLIAAGIVGG